MSAAIFCYGICISDVIRGKSIKYVKSESFSALRW